MTKLDAIAVGAVVGLLLGEGLARWLGLANPPGGDRVRWWTQFTRPSGNRLLLWELVPGTNVEGQEAHGRELYRINSLGMRGPAVNPEKGPGVFRVLALGDSYTFGLEGSEEDSFPHRLERLANGYSSTPIEVLNGGTPGYNTRQELAWLLERGLTLRPDLVILNVAANDVDPGMLDVWPAQVPPELWPAPPTRERGPDGAAGTPWDLGLWLKQRSALYQLAASRWDRLLVQGGTAATVPLGPLGNYQSPEWLWLRDGLGRIQAALAQGGVPLVVWFSPSQDEMTRDDWSGVASLFQRWSDESAVPMVDLWAVLHRREWRPLFRLFGHFTGEGNQVAAEAMHGLLQGKGLLPP